MEFLGSIGARNGSSELTPCALRFTIKNLRFALGALRYVEATMPAIAPIEDLRAAQKEGLSIYAMRYLSSKAETTASEDALCSMLYGNGAG
jgi:hypothetical protein